MTSALLKQLAFRLINLPRSRLYCNDSKQQVVALVEA